MSTALVEIDSTCTSTGSVVSVGGAAMVEISADCFVDQSDNRWRAVLVDKAADGGNVYATLPNAWGGPLDEALNDTGGTTIVLDPTAPEHAEAVAVITAHDKLPELEVQAWRGRQLWFWGPITDDEFDGEKLTLTVKDASDLLRDEIGEFGAGELLANTELNGGLGWGQALLQALDGGSDFGFLPLFPGYLNFERSVNVPGGGTVCRAEGPPYDYMMLHLWQDIALSVPAHRDLTVRFTGFYWVPADGDAGVPNTYAPTAPRYGLSLCVADPTVGTPSRWLEGALSTSTLPGEVPFDRWVPHVCELTLPAGSGLRTIHVGVNFPQGRAYFTAPSLSADHGRDFYDDDPCHIAAELVEQNYARQNIRGDQTSVSPNRISRSYLYHDHGKRLDAVTEMAREGWFDWSMSYTAARRTLRTHWPRRGQIKPRCAVWVMADGTSNVAKIRRSRMWSGGADGIYVQQTHDGVGYEWHYTDASPESAARWEDASTVRDAHPLELKLRARERFNQLRHPDTIEIQCKPGDTRFLCGLHVGDSITVHSEWAPLILDNTYRVVRKATDPATDTATFTLNFDPVLGT